MRVGGWVRSRLEVRTVLGIILAAPVLVTAAIGMEALVRARLDEGMFQAPTQFYARPIVFYPGLQLDRERVEAHLQRLGYRRVRRSSVRIGEYYRGSREWVIGRRAFRRHDRLDPGGLSPAPPCRWQPSRGPAPLG